MRGIDLHASASGFGFDMARRQFQTRGFLYDFAGNGSRGSARTDLPVEPPLMG